MRTPTIALLLVSVFTGLFTKAQEQAPKGYTRGAVTVNNQTKTGWLKEDFDGTGTVQFMDQNGKKQKLTGMDLQSVEIDTVKYLALKGDIFKVVSNGRLSLLQKISQVSGKPYYNGNEMVLMDGTEGKKGDYFLFLQQQNKLKLVSSRASAKTYQEIFEGNELAGEKASHSNGDLAQIKEAVTIYNKQ